MSIHQIKDHPEYVEGCFGCKISSLQISTGAGNASFSAVLERKLEKDRPAYKELRRQGYQPPSVTGASDLAERATTPTEIQMGRILPNAAKVEATLASYTGETGQSLLTPMTTPKKLN